MAAEQCWWWWCYQTWWKVFAVAISNELTWRVRWGYLGGWYHALIMNENRGLRGLSDGLSMNELGGEMGISWRMKLWVDSEWTQITWRMMVCQWMNLEGEMGNSFLWEEVIHLAVIIMIMVEMTRSIKKIDSDENDDYHYECKAIHLPVQLRGQQELCRGVEPLKGYHSVKLQYCRMQMSI